MRVDADQRHHKALEVVLRMAEDAGQSVRRYGRRGLVDPGEDEATCGVAEDHALLPKGPEDVPQNDVDRAGRRSLAGGDGPFDVVAGDLA
jgi:hypothetical protein